MKTININKVIKEIEKYRKKNNKFVGEFKSGIDSALEYAIQIIKDNIKEVDNDLIRLKMD